MLNAFAFQHTTRPCGVIVASEAGEQRPALLIVRQRRVRSSPSRVKVQFAHPTYAPGGARLVLPVAEFRIELN